MTALKFLSLVMPVLASNQILTPLLTSQPQIKIIDLSRPRLAFVSFRRQSRPLHSVSGSLKIFAVSSDDDQVPILNDKTQPSIEAANFPEKTTIDPLVASLTRVDEPPSRNVPSLEAPLIGEIPVDGNLALLLPSAVIAVVGLLYSVIIAIHSSDVIVQGFGSVELPKMEYTPAKIEEGSCRGLCSSQEENLKNLRGVMESFGGERG